MRRYEVEKTLLKELYCIFDTKEERYIVENINNKVDADLVVSALNYFKDC